MGWWLLGVDATGIRDSSTIGRDPTGSSKSSSSAAVIPLPKKKLASVTGEGAGDVRDCVVELEVVFWTRFGLLLFLLMWK